MNVLIETIVDGYMDDWIADLLDRLEIEECVTVYGNQPKNVKKVENGRVCTEYATCMLSYRDTINAEYELLKTHSVPPLDDAILNKMAPYEDVIFWMLERRLGREFTCIWRGYCEHIRVWSYLLEHYHVDVVIKAGLPHEGFDYIIYALCKIKGIPYIGCYPSHFLEYSYLINDIFNQLPDFQNYFKCLQNEYKNLSKNDIVLTDDMEKIYQFYFDKNNDITPWYMEKKIPFGSKAVLFLQKNCKLGRIIKRIGTIRTKNIGIMLQRGWKSKHLRRTRLILNRLQFLLKRLLVVGSLNLRIYESTIFWFDYTDVFREYEILIQYYRKNANAVDYTKKYIYVALHMQPEGTSSPLGGRYVDQILMVQMLSFCLPEGYILYVKEHPGQIKWEREQYHFRTLQFYRELLAIPKVQLVPFEEDTYKLIKGAQAVASLTGTAGFEAVIYNKAFLMFGYFLTMYAPNVFAIRNIDDCFAAMKKIQVFEPREEDTQKQMKIYFKALEKYIVKGHPHDDPLINKYVPAEYWEESKGNMTKAYLKNLIALMGDSILKRNIN